MTSIYVHVSDGGSKGIISSLFATELRKLGDVEVKDSHDDAQYRLNVLVMCMPTKDNCERATSYNVALLLSEQPSLLFAMRLDTATAMMSPDTALNMKNVNYLNVMRIHASLKHFDENLTTWTASWGRDGISRTIPEFVQTLDAQCFERTRILTRAIANRTPEEDIQRSVAGREWVC